MRRHQSHLEDSIALLGEQLAKGAINRRRFLQVATLLGATTAMGSAAWAQAKEIVLANAGGDAVTAMGQAYGEPYMKQVPATKVVIDGTFPSSAKIKAMVEAKNTTWDICDRNLTAALELGEPGLLQEIDYTVVDRNKLRPEHAGKWGCGSYIYSNVLAYQADAFGGRSR